MCLSSHLYCNLDIGRGCIWGVREGRLFCHAYFAKRRRLVGIDEERTVNLGGYRLVDGYRRRWGTDSPYGDVPPELGSHGNMGGVRQWIRSHSIVLVTGS